MKWFASFIFSFFMVAYGHCNTNRSYLVDLGLLNSQYVRILQDPDYEQLRVRVLDELQNSWCSEEKARLLMDLIVLECPQVCVEIGVFAGASFLPAAAVIKFLGVGDIYAIDPWSNFEATKNMADRDPNKAWWLRVDFEEVYQLFQAMRLRWNLHSHSHVMRLTSERAAKYIGKIDLLHMDGDYSVEGSVQDVELYLPKVRKGGYILFSNRLLTVDNKQPKMAAFHLLLNYCEVLHQMDHGNVVLLRKIVD